jgi:hypothetical protein
MSLLPVDSELKSAFLEGYKVYFQPTTEIENKVMENIVQRIADYNI